MAPSPTPPQPITATLSPRVTPPVLMAAPMPAITPQPSRPAVAAGMAGLTLVHWPGGDQRLLRERADAQRRGQHGAVLQRHLLGRVVGVEAVPRPAAAAGAAPAAHRAPVQDDEVAGRHVGHVRAHGVDHAGRLVAKEVREVVADAALLVVQVGVAHPARLHGDERLPRPGLGHQDRRHLYRLALTAGHHAPNADRHVSTFHPSGGREIRVSSPRSQQSLIAYQDHLP